MYIYIRDLESGCAWHALCNANDWSIRAGVVLDQLSNLSGFSFTTLSLSLSLRLFHLFFSSLCFCAVACSVLRCCMWLCCVCVSVCVVVSCVWSWPVCLGEANKWRTRQRGVVLDLFSNWQKVTSMGFFVELLEHVAIQRGQGLVSRNWRWPPHTSSPCVRSKRLRVYRHHTHMSVHTCGRVAGTHGDVLDVHTGFFQVSLHSTPLTTPHHDNDTRQRQRQRHTTTHNLQLHSTQHGKTHQVQTQQGLTDSSFFIFSVVLRGRFLSW